MESEAQSLSKWPYGCGSHRIVRLPIAPPKSELVRGKVMQGWLGWVGRPLERPRGCWHEGMSATCLQMLDYLLHIPRLEAKRRVRLVGVRKRKGNSGGRVFCATEFRTLLSPTTPKKKTLRVPYVDSHGSKAPTPKWYHWF